jgi:hypothetical protein
MVMQSGMRLRQCDDNYENHVRILRAAFWLHTTILTLLTPCSRKFECFFTNSRKFILNVLWRSRRNFKNISKKSLFHVSFSSYKAGSFKKMFNGLLIALTCLLHAPT